MNDKYQKVLQKLNEEKLYREERDRKYYRDFVLDYFIVIGIGLLLSIFVCSVGSFYGDLTPQCWIIFGLNSLIVFTLIYIYRLGMLLAILLYVLSNNMVIYMTIWHEYNQVAELGLVMEFGSSVFGFLFAYSLGVKHYFEDVAI